MLWCLEMIIYFEVNTILNKKVRVTKRYWSYITKAKHPSVCGREEYVKKALEDPIEVRRSRRDPNVYLYYGLFKDKLICVVVKHLNEEGFIIIAYPTRRIASGEIVWKKH